MGLIVAVNSIHVVFRQGNDIKTKIQRKQKRGKEKKRSDYM